MSSSSVHILYGGPAGHRVLPCPPPGPNQTVVEEGHRETDEMERALRTGDNVLVYTPCPDETAEAVRALLPGRKVVVGRPGPHHHTPMTTTTTSFPPDVVTIDGILHHAREAVQRVAAENVVVGVWLVFMPSRRSAETLAQDFPYVDPGDGVSYYVYAGRPVRQLKRPCVVIGGPEMDAWDIENELVDGVIDSLSGYRREALYDWSLLPIGRARWMSRRLRAWESYVPLGDPSRVVRHEFTGLGDPLDMLKRALPAAGALAGRLDGLMRRCDLPLLETHCVPWERVEPVLVSLLPAYNALSADTAVLDDGETCVRGEGLVAGTRGVFARRHAGRICARIVTGQSRWPVRTRRIDTRGIQGVACLRYATETMPLVLRMYTRGHAIVSFFDERVADRVEGMVNALREASVNHTITVRVAPTIHVRLSGGFAFDSLSDDGDGGMYSLTAVYRRMTPVVGRLLATGRDRGWFASEDTFLFHDRDAYLSFRDAVYTNEIPLRSCIMTKTRRVPLRRSYRVTVSWFDGASTGFAIVGDRRIAVDRAHDEQAVAEMYGVPVRDVRVLRSVRRISRTLPGGTDATLVARGDSHSCTATVTVPTLARLAVVRASVPRHDELVNQPVRARVGLFVEDRATPVSEWGLWDDEPPSGTDPYTRLRHVDPVQRCSYVLGSESVVKTLQTTTRRCDICFDDALPTHVLGVCGCDNFCVPCLQDYVNTCLEEFRECVTCPSVDCRRPLHVADVIALAHPDRVDAYATMLGGVLATRMRDRIVTCPGGCGSLAAAGGTAFACETCAVEYCMTCFADHRIARETHTGFCGDGADGHAWRDLQREAREAGLVMCPGCETPYDKDHNCRHVTCASATCRTHFCYGCGVAFSNSPTSPDARARVVRLEEDGAIAVVVVDATSWSPEGIVAMPVGEKRIRVEKMQRCEDDFDSVYFPTYVYEHMEVCPV
jgi:hypothetical protein